MEVAYIFDYPDFIRKSIFVIEVDSTQRFVSEVVEGELKKYYCEIRIAEVKVNNDEEMVRAIESNLIDFIQSFPKLSSLE